MARVLMPLTPIKLGENVGADGSGGISGGADVGAEGAEGGGKAAVPRSEFASAEYGLW